MQKLESTEKIDETVNYCFDDFILEKININDYIIVKKLEEIINKKSLNYQRETRWLKECSHIYRCPNDGSQSENERYMSILREKKLWWRHNFHDELPEIYTHNMRGHKNIR